MTVEHYLQKDVLTVACDAPAGAAALRMRETGVGCVVVVDGNDRPIGILTDRDLAMRVVAAGLDPVLTRIEDVMSRPLVSVEPNDSIDSALEAMANAGVRRLPVVAGGWCAGLVTLDDVLLELSHELRDLTLGVHGRVRSTRRHAHVERMASHVGEWASDALAWVGDRGRQVRGSAEKLVGELRRNKSSGPTQ